MTTIVYEKTFIFNELKFFTELLNNEKGMTDLEKEDILLSMNLESVDFKFTYQKDSDGSWFMRCYKGDERIEWDDVENWMRACVWDFEKENGMYFN